MKILPGLLIACVRARRGAGAPAGHPGIGAHRQSRPRHLSRISHPTSPSTATTRSRRSSATSNRGPAAIRETSSMTSRSTCSIAPPAAGRRCGSSSCIITARSAASIPGSRCATASPRWRSIRCTSSSGAMATGCPHPITGVDPGNARRFHHHRRHAHPVRRHQRPVAGHALREKFATGVWGPTSLMLGDYRGGDDEFTGGPVDISGGRAVVLSPYNEEEFPVASPGCHGVSRMGTAGALPAPVRHSRAPQAAPLGFEVAIRGDEIFIAGTNLSGTRVYRPAPSDAWEEFDKLQPLDSHMGGGVTTVIEKNHLFLMQRNWNAEREAYVINVFRKTAERTLRTRGDAGLERRRIAGQLRHQQPARDRELRQRGVLSSNCRRVSASPQPIQHTFAASNAHGMVDERRQRVLDRSARHQPGAAAVRHAESGDAHRGSRCFELDQSVRSGGRAPARVRRQRQLDGLATRYRDAGNYYYVMVSGSGIVTLRRAVGGVLTTVASAPFAVTLNRPYRAAARVHRHASPRLHERRAGAGRR